MRFYGLGFLDHPCRHHQGMISGSMPTKPKKRPEFRGSAMALVPLFRFSRPDGNGCCKPPEKRSTWAVCNPEHPWWTHGSPIDRPRIPSIGALLIGQRIIDIIWVNWNSSVIWNVGPFGDDLPTMIPLIIYQGIHIFFMVFPWFSIIETNLLATKKPTSPGWWFQPSEEY